MLQHFEHLFERLDMSQAKKLYEVRVYTVTPSTVTVEAGSAKEAHELVSAQVNTPENRAKNPDIETRSSVGPLRMVKVAR